MFACLYSLSTPVTALVKLAEDFTPRFEVVGPLVMLDVSGLSRLFGSPQEIGEQMRRSGSGPIRIALAPTQTAATLLAMGRPGLTVVLPGEQPAALAALPVSLLADFDRQRVTGRLVSPTLERPTPAVVPAGVPFEDSLPYLQQSCLDRASDAAIRAHCGGGGWMHPRDSHAANQTRHARRPVTTPRDLEHAHASAPSALGAADAPAHRTAPDAPVAPSALVAPMRAALKSIDAVHDTLRRWGIKTFGAFAALPAGDVYERLGARGVLWQRLARGEDTTPLVPWIPEDPFEAALDLEWPIEGLEPLSFVLGRLFDPLAERLERADRGAAIVHTHLRLVGKEVHARTLQLPAPMRDAKTLRTLVLLDLETNPPAAAIDRVRVLIEPTPGRVLQWGLFERAQASPEQVSTLLARLTALMGEAHVGSPQLIDSWKPGAFHMTPFAVPAVASAAPEARARVAADAPRPPSERVGTTAGSALRRFRLPVPARVHVHEGRPVRVMTDRRGVTGGAIVQASGPWRTAGEWWQASPSHLPHLSPSPSLVETLERATAGLAYWDRDEWDVALHDGTIYRISVERDAGQWFIEGVID